MPNARLLIIDDEPTVCYSFRRVLEKRPFEIKTAATVRDGLDVFESFGPDVVVLDLNLPDANGMEAFRHIRRQDPKCPVVFITAHGTTETALEAMKEGAFDYLIKPVDLDRLSELLERALEAARLMRVPALLPTRSDGDRIIGRAPVMQEMCKLIGLLASKEVNVLIMGESGVGKELVARALYQHSRRADKPFLAINCAAMPEQLLESELFGHEIGAFTGAVRQRIGKFEQCRDGTLFLDEIGDMALGVQAKMLRLLQDQTFERVGGNQLVQTNVRIVAATNQDLPKLVAEGRFRADLYYRLKVASLHVPPLRERREDIAELALYFLQHHNRRWGLELHGFSEETLTCLQAYSWPGNVRELQSVVKEAMVHTRGPLVLPEYLPPSLQPVVPALEEKSHDPSLPAFYHQIEDLLKSGHDNLYDQAQKLLDRYVLPEVLRQTKNNQARASEILGIDRKTLRQKLRALGLAPDSDELPLKSGKALVPAKPELA
jgi:DNA-binding NtrC family response regulator